MASDDERLVPDGIRDARWLAMANLVGRFGELPVENLLVYLIDHVDASALPHLAEEFGVQGPAGWDLAKTEAARRALLKKAWRLKRRAGTPWAIKEMIKAVGYPDATVTIRHPVRYYDGTWNHDRTDYYATSTGRQSALFRVYVELGEDLGIAAGDAGLIIGAIDVYKRLVAWLQHLGFRSTLADQVETDEALAVTIRPAMADALLYAATYDGTHRHNRTIAHQNRAETTTTTIRYRTLFNGLRLYNGATYHGATFEEAV